MITNIQSKSKTPSHLTYLLTLVFIALIFLLFYKDIPDGNQNIIYTLIGSYTTVYLGCMSYWFGTTYSSSDKDKMIYQSTPIEGSKESSQ